MSGIHQDHVRKLLRGEGDRLLAAPGRQRPEPGHDQHVARELQVLRVVVHDQNEWRSGRHRPIL
jgi:hypothetical protein